MKTNDERLRDLEDGMRATACEWWRAKQEGRQGDREKHKESFELQEDLLCRKLRARGRCESVRAGRRLTPSHRWAKLGTALRRWAGVEE